MPSKFGFETRDDRQQAKEKEEAQIEKLWSEARALAESKGSLIQDILLDYGRTLDYYERVDVTSANTEWALWGWGNSRQWQRLTVVGIRPVQGAIKLLVDRRDFFDPLVVILEGQTELEAEKKVHHTVNNWYYENGSEVNLL